MIKPELLIKINADLKDFNKKMDQVKKQTEELSETLNKVGLVAGAAFAGLSIVTFKTVEAFKGAKQASNQLEQSLKTQGIFSEELLQSYKGMASELQKLVAVDDDAVIAGQAILQRFIGQNKITKELTLATIDFAQANKIDLDSAFKLVGKTIGSKMNPLARQYGIELQDGLTVSEKMAVVTQKLNERFAGQAKAVADAKGPFEALKLSFQDFQEGVGEQLEPLLNGFADTLNNITLGVNENQTAFKAIATIIAGGLGVAGLTTLVVLGAKAFVALNVTALTLGVTLTALTGGIFAVVAGIGLLVASVATAESRLGNNGPLKTVEDANKRLIEQNKKLIELQKQKKQGLAVDPEIQVLQMRIKKTQEQINTLDKLKISQEKVGSITSGKETIDALEAESKKREELRKQREDDAKKEIEDRKKLKKDLIDAGKDELSSLNDLRDRRIKLAGNDKELLLLIEKEYQDKRFKLQKDTDEKLAELRRAQAEYEKLQREKSIKDIQSAASNPFSIVGGFAGKTDKEKKDSLIGAGAGIANNVANGAEGARNLVVTGAKAAIDSFVPGLGEALGPLLQSFTQGPEATRAMVREFAQALPDIIQAFIEAIPVFIEEFSNQIPIIIERLAEKAPEIITALVRAMPRVGVALALQMPMVATSLIKEMPNMAVQFVTSLVREAPRFVTELIKSLGKGVGGIASGAGDVAGSAGGFLGKAASVVSSTVSTIKKIFKFADGGQIFAKSVPSGFPNDSFPAMLQSGELVVDRSTASGLRDFINRENAGGGDVNTSLLSQILSIVSAPIMVDTSVQVNQKAFADIILQLNRQNQRLA